MGVYHKMRIEIQRLVLKAREPIHWGNYLLGVLFLIFVMHVYLPLPVPVPLLPGTTRIMTLTGSQSPFYSQAHIRRRTHS